MTTRMLYLEKSGREDEPGDWEVLRMASGDFLEPECYAYAIGLNRALGWSMHGLMKRDVIWHALVKSPKGLLDFRGTPFATDDWRLGEPFGLKPPYVIRPVSESDLLATRPVPERYIAQAQKAAEALHPEYPWPNPLSRRMYCFADELEALSRKYGIWIRGDIPTQLPILTLADGDNDESGYDLQLVADGRQCTINRRLR